ncbi:MAG: putative toxin-antitoxin system toxin component, PIN family [Anaerolineales bacterium]|nr:putative toxin-antitoxin system toxin component, PIN family [Anaerolineales bacterium]
MKIVLDTNVFISGVFFSGPPYQILKAWQDGKIQLAVSPEILDEYYRVGEILAEEHPNIDLKPMLDFLVQNAEIYAATPLPEAVCNDPDDDKFLACALACESTVIVSGDKHLLSISGYHQIDVLKPSDFVKKHLA